VSDYTKVDSGELYHELGADGQKWTVAFKQHNPDCNVDDGTLLAWFCNAVMAGHDAALGNPPMNGDHAQWLLDHDSSNALNTNAFGGQNYG